MRQVLLASAFILATSGAMAAALPEECEKIKGTITCIDPTANDNASDNGQTNSQEVTTTSQGNLKNKQECSGPGGSTSGC